jgi:hypothetical protein
MKITHIKGCNVGGIGKLARINDGNFRSAIIPFLPNGIVVDDFRLVLDVWGSQDDGSVVLLIESLAEYLR